MTHHRCDGVGVPTVMLIEPVSLREGRVAYRVFWVLVAVMLALIYRDLCLGVWSEMAATGDQWLHQLVTVSESVFPQPDVAPLQPIASTPLASIPPVLEQPVLEQFTQDAPQTVGDLIANLQQQDAQTTTP